MFMIKPLLFVLALINAVWATFLVLVGFTCASMLYFTTDTYDRFKKWFVTGEE